MRRHDRRAVVSKLESRVRLHSGCVWIRLRNPVVRAQYSSPLTSACSRSGIGWSWCERCSSGIEVANGVSMHRYAERSSSRSKRFLIAGDRAEMNTGRIRRSTVSRDIKRGSSIVRPKRRANSFTTAPSRLMVNDWSPDVIQYSPSRVPSRMSAMIASATVSCGMKSMYASGEAGIIGNDPFKNVPMMLWKPWKREMTPEFVSPITIDGRMITCGKPLLRTRHSPRLFETAYKGSPSCCSGPEHGLTNAVLMW